MELNERSGVADPVSPDLRTMVEEVADQLCLTIGGNFDHLVEVEGHDESIEKLEMVVNFVLATASRSIGEVRRSKAALEEQLHVREKLESENAYLREEVFETRSLGEMVGRSPQMKHVAEQVALVAPTVATVLIHGESGTGKELVASAIHRASKRGNGPMVRVNCAAVPHDLFESEFFGHVKGAFTGAVRDRVGRFQLASGGTLFLDEVSEIPIELQGKLLRAIQEGEYTRLGSHRTEHTDVRLVAATNRDLSDWVRRGKFREDLFYRLNVFPIAVSPLRERPEDIALLAAHFLERACQEMNKPTGLLTSAALEMLTRYDWPGNVRELQNVVERAVILSRGGPIAVQLPEGGDRTATSLLGSPLPDGRPTMRIRTEAEFREAERANIVAALDRTRWKVYGRGGAAELLGIKPGTLAARMKKLGLRRGA